MRQGFTLIEILVSATVFVIVMTAFLNLFVSAFHYQKQAILQAEVLNSASYVVEYLSRALRMAQKDLSADGDCADSKKNYKQPSGDTSIQFLNSQGKCQLFFLQDNQIKVITSSDGTAPGDLSLAQPLTPLTLFANKLKFAISGDGQDDGKQPRVTFVIELMTKGAEPRKINLQTAVSQRQLDVTY